MWSTLRQRFRSALRFKLLALVLVPLAFALAATLGYTLYWFHSYTQETLQVAVRDDLVLARHALRQLQDDYQLELQQLAESAPFRTLLQRNERAAIQRALRRTRDAKGFAFLHVTGIAGNWLFETAEGTSKPSTLTDRAGRGLAGAALEVFRPEDLRREGAGLAARARIARSAGDGDELRGLVLRLTQPILDEQGRIAMTLDAAVLLNQNASVLEAIRHRVFAADVLPPSAEPTVALLLDDTRIAVATTAPTAMLGDRLPPPLRAAVVEGSDSWIGQHRLGDAEYVAAYGPLFDINGQRVGTLQVGVRASAYRAGYARAAALLLLLYVTVAALAAWIAVRGVRSVVQPIETMASVARATAAGADRRIGPIHVMDEVGALAHQFDAMLDQLAARNRDVQRAAVVLEHKVEERTQELAQSNTELKDTIVLLERTRNQLVLAEKLSALGQMAAGIAHEINNPAAVILGNLDVLSAELGAQARPVAREIDLIAQQVERIRHIVTSLLQFARARPGEGQVEEVRVNQLIEDVLPLVSHALKAKSLVLRRRLEATGTVAINLYDLEQVLINLIVNAANACDDGGRIEIATADAPPDGAVISVADNGHGIAAEHIKRVFDPFFTTDNQRGVGLGLSVSYGLVHRYGGDITVESTPARGTIFHVHLLRHPLTTSTPRALEEMSHG